MYKRFAHSTIREPAGVENKEICGVTKSEQPDFCGFRTVGGGAVASPFLSDLVSGI
jgi:hypothetical protein